MEIERKFSVKSLPPDLSRFPSLLIEQVYLCRDPAVRARREGDAYLLTYKSGPRLAHEEVNLPLTAASYGELRRIAGGCLIRKRRVRIPYGSVTIELDLFEEPFDDLALAEVEFPDKKAALSFSPPPWFGEDVTGDDRFRNSQISRTRYRHHSFREPEP